MFGCLSRVLSKVLVGLFDVVELGCLSTFLSQLLGFIFVKVVVLPCSSKVLC